MTRLISMGFEEQGYLAQFSAISDTIETSLIQGRLPRNTALKPRTGYSALYLNNVDYISIDLPSYPTQVYMGVAFYQVGSPINSIIIELYTTAYSSGLNLRLSETALAIYRVNTKLKEVTGLANLLDAWHYLEIWLQPLNSNGNFQVKLDGTKIDGLDYLGDTTDSNERIEGLRLTGRGTYTLFDDFVLNDASGATNNTWPGQVRLLPIGGISTGSSAEWSRAGMDMGANYAQVLHQNDGFTVVQTNTADKKDLYTTAVPDLPAGATIKNVIVSAMARRDSGSGSIAPLLKSGATESIGTTSALTSAWKFYSDAYPKNPADSADWEEADLSTLQIGVQSK